MCTTPGVRDNGPRIKPRAAVKAVSSSVLELRADPEAEIPSVGEVSKPHKFIPHLLPPPTIVTIIRKHRGCRIYRVLGIRFCASKS